MWVSNRPTLDLAVLPTAACSTHKRDLGNQRWKAYASIDERPQPKITRDENCQNSYRNCCLVTLKFHQYFQWGWIPNNDWLVHAGRGLRTEKINEMEIPKENDRRNRLFTTGFPVILLSVDRLNLRSDVYECHEILNARSWQLTQTLSRSVVLKIKFPGQILGVGSPVQSVRSVRLRL